MKLNIDQITYYIDGTQISQHLKSLYEYHSHVLDNPIELTTGKGTKKKIDFRKKSILRLGVKTALVPFIVPFLEAVYSAKGLTLPKHEKHTDFIDYLVLQLLNYSALIEKDVCLYVKSDETNDSNVRLVRSIATSGEGSTEPTRELAETSQHKKD